MATPVPSFKLVEPSVKVHLQGDSTDEYYEHLAKCARVCYASTKITDNLVFANNLINSGHISPFRHGTKYYKFPQDIVNNDEFNAIYYSPYCNVFFNMENGYYYVSVNGQYYIEHFFIKALKQYESSLHQFIQDAKESKYEQDIYELLRFTVIGNTQISTSREFNRVSPNNICEQSTRYCNFSKDKFGSQVAICKPHWFDKLGNEQKQEVLNDFEKACSDYIIHCIEGWPPQDAREFLPLCTNTVVCYTYSLKEWKHIIDLRYYGTTGKPHPNAFIFADLIRKELNSVFNRLDINYIFLKTK